MLIQVQDLVGIVSTILGGSLITAVIFIGIVYTIESERFKPKPKDWKVVWERSRYK